MEFISKIVINQGWSDDKKYCVTDKNYQKYFLRVCNKEKLNSKKFEFNMMQKIASLGVPMCKPDVSMILWTRFGRIVSNQRRCPNESKIYQRVQGNNCSIT